MDVPDLLCPIFYRDSSGKYYSLDGGRKSVSAPPDYTSVPVHHICTNKCDIGASGSPAWTPKFQTFFKNSDLNINSEINKIAVPGHRGPHPRHIINIFTSNWMMLREEYLRIHLHIKMPLKIRYIGSNQKQLQLVVK